MKSHNGHLGIIGPALLAVVAILLGAPSVFAQFDELSAPAQTSDSTESLPTIGKEGETLPPRQALATYPEIRFQMHNNGRFWNTMNNNGIMGNYFEFVDSSNTRYMAPNFQYPEHRAYFYGDFDALWIGGIVGDDTLVSSAINYDSYSWWTGYPRELWPDYTNGQEFAASSNDPESPIYDPEARAPLQFTAVYTDTVRPFDPGAFNEYDQRYHRPLGLKITQTSYSWPDKFAEDFIIVDFLVENIGDQVVKQAYFGIFHTGRVNARNELPSGAPPSDDQVGFINTWPHQYPELGEDTVRIAYAIDADGWAGLFPWDRINTANAYCMAALRLPAGATRTNFNWISRSFVNGRFNWWGPRKRTYGQGGPRYFYGQLGYPYGDNNKYWLMANPEIDHGSAWAALEHPGWLPPPTDGAVDLASGHYPRFLYSVGPTTFGPGSQRHFTMVFFIGEGVHSRPDAWDQKWSPYNPGLFMDQLDWRDAISNYRWARTLFDKPGFDTNRDGDSGIAFTRIDPASLDTLRIFYQGDGHPDFRLPDPPPPPEVRVITEAGKITVRWNGQKTENAYDAITSLKDFEGYRVYISRSESDRVGYSLVRSWDVENYNRWEWVWERERWELVDPPYSLDSLRTMYGENFEAEQYHILNPFTFNYKHYYFDRVDANYSDLAEPEGIRKVYPDAIKDASDVDEHGRMRYYEYEYTIENLMTTIPYWVSVTAFDHGFPAASLNAYESNPVENAVQVFAQDRTDQQALEQGQLKAYVYPNPYRTDGDYDELGYENVGQLMWKERARAIYFANIPSVCDISIYSLDGDLVRKIIHNQPDESGTAGIAKWDMINKNSEMVTSGLYYWVVESEYGTQIGKLMIIR